jgi:UDP-glucose 4-epimerase
MEQTSKVIAITGAAGYIGRRLLQELEQNWAHRKLVAFDTKPLAFPIHNVAAYRQDVTEPIDGSLYGRRVTTLVHLAFNASAGRNRREVAAIRQSNLDALRSVLVSCARARVRHFIFLSSHTVYGAHRDNPIPLTDDAPLRPLADFPYGYDKFVSEDLIREFAAQNQDLKVTILRPCIVLGPNAQNSISKGLFRRVLLGVLGYNPPLQFLYEDDLARVLAIIIGREVPGVFNVAGEGVVFYRELAAIIKSRLLSLPAFLAYPAAQLTWNLGIQRDSTASGLDLVRYPIMLDTSKLRRATGYRFWHTSLETLSSFTNSCLLYRDPESNGSVA